jgi:hypothetical protein
MYAAYELQHFPLPPQYWVVFRTVLCTFHLEYKRAVNERLGERGFK